MFNENLDLLFDTMSEDAVINGVTVKVLLQHSREVFKLDEEMVASETEYLLAKESDISTLKQGDTITFRNKTMYVVELYKPNDGLAAIYISNSL